MQNSSQAQMNITVGLQRQGSLERALLSILSTIPCCTFLYINGVMLFTLRSKPVFRERSRYILLYNLLFADTIQLATTQIFYILATCRITLTFLACGAFTMLVNLTSEISPLTLVVMSLERYVAVCYPLRHAVTVTMKNTAMAITVVWAFSALNVVIRICFMLSFDFVNLETLQQNDICSKIPIFLVPMYVQYNRVYTCFVFLLAGVVIISSYTGVILAARSAATDKVSARKARNTVLLHLLQLVLSLSSTMYSSIITSVLRILGRLAAIRMQTVLYVCVFLLPRCLSALIYGLRDQTIRPILKYHLSRRLKLSVVPDKAELWPHVM